MSIWSQISKCSAKPLRGIEYPLVVAGVLIAFLALVGVNAGNPTSVQADGHPGWVTTTLASSSVWLNVNRHGSFIEFNLNIQMETESCHRIADSGVLEKPIPQQFVINLVKEQRTNLEICSGQSPVMRTFPYGPRFPEPGSYEFIVRASDVEVKRWTISIISDDRVACADGFNDDFHLDRFEVLQIVTAYLSDTPIEGFGVPDREQTIDALTHYMLYGSYTPPTLVCVAGAMPRWKMPLEFVPPRFVFVAEALNVIVRTLESVSSDQIVDVTVSITATDPRDSYENAVDASSTTCGVTRPDFIERCWTAEIKDVPSNWAFIDQHYEVMVESSQIPSGMNATFTVESINQKSDDDSGRHIVVSQFPPVSAVVAVEYDVSSVDILRLVDDDTSNDREERQANVDQAYLQVRFEAHEIADTTHLTLTHRVSESGEAGHKKLPVEVNINGQILDHSSGMPPEIGQVDGHETIIWPIAYLLQEGENVVEIHFVNAETSGYQLERLEITR